MAKRGPKTEAGRQVVRYNALKHGLLARSPVIPGLETEEEWQRFHAELRDHYDPQNAAEAALVERIADAFWRLRRVGAAEAGLVAVRQHRVPQDYARVAAYRDEPGSPEAADAEIERGRRAAATLSRLPRLDGAASLEASDASAALLAIDAVDDELLDLPLPGVPEGVDPVDFLGWTVPLLREAIGVMARHLGCSPDALCRQALARAHDHVAEAERKREALFADMEAMRQERLLPDPKQLQALARHEAHLGRQLYQALHALHAEQARRTGASVPLSQVQVYGLPGS